MPTIRIPNKQCFVLDGQSWSDYTRWLKMFDERSPVRITVVSILSYRLSLQNAHNSLADGPRGRGVCSQGAAS